MSLNIEFPPTHTASRGRAGAIQDSEFKEGQLVRHPSFGLGTVEQFVDMGENSIVVVRFNTGQTKTLMLKYANLSKILENRR